MGMRIAELHDLDGICKLYDEFYAYNASLQPDYCKPCSETGEYPKDVIEDPNADILIATNNDDVIGLVHIRQRTTPPHASLVQHKYAEIIDCITTEAQRKKGVGTRLMQRAKQWAEDRNLEYIELFVLNEAKKERRFYESLDFEVVSATMRLSL